MEGTKHDQNKTRLELLPTEALEEVAKILTYGAHKYAQKDSEGRITQTGDWNWAKGMSWSRLIGAAFRHLFAWVRGESRDSETGLSHISHCICCLLFLSTYELKGLGADDRSKL